MQTISFSQNPFRSDTPVQAEGHKHADFEKFLQEKPDRKSKPKPDAPEEPSSSEEEPTTDKPTPLTPLMPEAGLALLHDFAEVHSLATTLDKSLPPLSELPEDLHLTVLRHPMQGAGRQSLLSQSPPPTQPLPKATDQVFSDAAPPPPPEELVEEVQLQAEVPEKDSVEAKLPKKAEASVEWAPTMDLEEKSEPLAAVHEVAPRAVPDLPAPLPNHLHLEVRDSLGVWGLSMQRDAGGLQLDFQGDEQLKQVVQSSNREIQAAVARSGETLSALHWRPTVEATAQSDRSMGQQRQEGRETASDQRESQQQSQQQQSRQSSQEQPSFSQEQARKPAPRTDARRLLSRLA